MCDNENTKTILDLIIRMLEMEEKNIFHKKICKSVSSQILKFHSQIKHVKIDLKKQIHSLIHFSIDFVDSETLFLLSKKLLKKFLFYISEKEIDKFDFDQFVEIELSKKTCKNIIFILFYFVLFYFYFYFYLFLKNL